MTIETNEAEQEARHIQITISHYVIVFLLCVIGAFAGVLLHERDKNAALLAEHEQAVREIEAAMAERNPKQDGELRRQRARTTFMAAYRHGLDYRKFTRVFAVESDFECDKISEKGAKGCLQLMPMWVGIAPGIETEADLLDPAKNINGGAWVLNYMVKRCGYEKMFACYEGGEQAANWKHDTGYTAKVQKVRMAGRGA